MKKVYLLSLLLVCALGTAIAKTVPVSTAKTVGYYYLTQHGQELNGENDLQLVYTSGGAQAYFYVFSGKECFVMVAADDAVTPVLAYSKDRSFTTKKLPDFITSFLENYDSQIAYAIANHLEGTAEVAAKWDNLKNNRSEGPAAKTTSVAPLLNTTWNQSPYYNDNCPYDAAGGGRSVSGCVATATAQVMKYWSWPATGVGFHSYSTSSYGTLSANYGATSYNWAAMPNNVTSANAAVATLMYHVGVGVDMSYSASSSGAYVISSFSPVTHCAEYALKNYFNYSPATYGAMRTSYSDAAWIALIEGELDASRPVIYAGYGTAGGHCFVADGYDASHKFHINWGWGGGGPDGYYDMDALNPPTLGTGGGGGGFNDDQHAIINLQPTGGGAPASLELTDYVTLSKYSMSYADTFSVQSNIVNTGTADFIGSLSFAAFNATTGAFVTYLDSFVGINLPAGFTFSAPGLVINNINSVPMIPGDYYIKAMYRKAGSGVWALINDGGGGAFVNAAPMQVYNHNFMQMYSAMGATPSPLVQGSAGSVALKLYNEDASFAYNDSLYLGLYNLNGTFNSDIQALPATSIPAATISGTLTFSTSSITAAPGTYLLVAWFKYSGGWYICGADYAENPAYVTVVAPPPPPDIYEVNNTAATAYNLTPSLTWSSSNTASTSTPGSTIHIGSDEDYYKVTLAAGYDYTISARVNDAVNKDDAGTYTNDVLWSYSTNGGSSWSPVYNNTMAGTINLTGATGGTVVFHVSSVNAGGTGSYLLKLKNITRTAPVNMADPRLEAVQIFPNPATDMINIDMSGTGFTASSVMLTNMSGRVVYNADADNQSVATVSLTAIPAGIYFLSVKTEGGTINKKITVTR